MHMRVCGILCVHTWCFQVCTHADTLTDCSAMIFSYMATFLMFVCLWWLQVQMFTEGETVKILEDEHQVRELQKNHGEWTDIMRQVCSMIGLSGFMFIPSFFGIIVRIYVNPKIRCDHCLDLCSFQYPLGSLSWFMLIPRSFLIIVSIYVNPKISCDHCLGLC